MKVALISPRGPLYRHRSGIFGKSLRYAPLTLTTLAALVPPELEVELALYDEGIEEIPLDLQADLVGISAITGTASRSYQLAAQFRARGVPVVLGGVHPTLCPEEAAQHADCVVTGYAEESWPQVLRDFAGGAMASRYSQDPNLDLGGRPRPRRDLIDLSKYLTPHTVEATRGCIHHCRFCVVPSAWGRPRQKPIPEVIQDIEMMNTSSVLFLDLNLIADEDYAKKLFRALIPLKLRWAGLATTKIAWDDELLRLASASGCSGLLIGFETVSMEALAESAKKFNNHQSYDLVIRKLHDAGIAIMGTFVFGFDADDRDIFARVSEFAVRTKIDLPRYAVLTPFPGTPLHRRLLSENRILTRDWELYDGQHVVYKPARMSPQELQQGVEWAWKETYSWANIARRLAGSRRMLLKAMAANLGYRFYGYNLDRFYTCGAEVIAA
ncbi:MAG: radical SAM protein [Vulcanimicrobiota bacterium]